MPTVHTIAVMPELPTKKTDPGASIISCLIAENTFRNVLLDDGASVNLLPASVVEKFSLGAVKLTPMTLEFADRSSTQPKGFLEDVIVTVQGHNFPVDFDVLDVKHSDKMPEISIILCRPFLATTEK